jgi:amino acid adenylation domain-containing protein
MHGRIVSKYRKKKMQDEVLEAFHLSPQQKHLYILQQNSPAYRAQCAILIEGELDIDTLKKALQNIVNHHEILRTTFHSLPGMKFSAQVVADSSTPLWQEINLCDYPPQKQAAHIEQLFEEERRCPFDLNQGPLFRLLLLALSVKKYILLVSLPSLCADAWTLNSLVHEISRAYDAGSKGKELSDKPVQYVHFSGWQNELLEEGDAETGRAFWQKRMGFVSSTLTLPCENKPGAETAFDPASLVFTMDPDLVVKIEAIVRKSAIPASVLLLACWQVLLWRLTGQPDIVVGAIWDGRKYEELLGALGLFAKCLPIPCHFERNFHFRHICEQLHTAVREAYVWQDYFTWEQYHASVDDAARSPYFPISFAFEERPGKLYAADASLLIYKQYSCINRFHIHLSCIRVNDSLTAEFHYHPEHFQREHVEGIARQFATLVKSALPNLEAPIGKLEILSAADRQQLLVEWNHTAADYPRNQCVHQLFEMQVERTPDCLAVVWKDQQLTYAQLNARANQLAHFLRAFGVASEVLVGLCVERSVEMLIGLLGILKAGGAYVPLHPENPKARLAQQLVEIQAPVLLTQEKLLGQLPDFGGKVCCLDLDQKLFASAPMTNPTSITTPQHLAYVIYTSGSTGIPKGVAVLHQSLVNYTQFMCQKLCLQALPTREGLHFATVSTLGTDLGNTCIFPSLVSGGCLYILSDEVAMDGGMFASYAAEQPIDVLKIVPSHLSALMTSSPDGADILPRKHLILGGETFSFELSSRIAKTSSICKVINHYGPTETTIGSLTFDLDTHGVCTRISSTVPIGRPIANTEIYILDQHLNPVPIGVPGELYIGGAGLARGYIHQPKQTAERFLPHPFSHDPQARLFKTGDVVRYLPDGSVEFLGRVDHQVKIRGFRIELGEIEAALRQHSGVREAVVVTREAPLDTKRLVAYVVPDEEPAPASSDLRHFLQTHLPEYMVPAIWVVLKTLPLASNGKIDRHALPVPEQSSFDPVATFIAPRTPVEEMVAGLWAQVLGVEHVGIDDNFFALGGHSLLATQVMSRVRDAFHVELPLRCLFETPTVAALAANLDTALRSSPGVRVLPLQPVAREGELPLSFAQQRLWFLDQLEPNNPFYNLPGAIRAQGLLQVAALEQTCSAIVRRHEALRTTFPAIQGRPVQVITPAQPLALLVIDLCALPATVREAAMQRLVYTETQRPFDLARGPLVRLTLLRLAADTHVMLLTMHHIVSDAWSLGIFLRELGALYTAYTTGQPASLPALPIQYVDFAVWQRQWLRGEVLEAQLAHWRRQLASAPPVLELPTDRLRPTVQTFQGASHTFTIAPSLVAALQALSQHAGVTLFMTLLAAFTVLLQRYTGQDDIVVGAPSAGRTQVETESLIGCFFNTLVLRIDVTRNPSVRELLSRVREVCLEAYAHQDVPFEMLVEVLQPARALRHTPLFQVLFALQNVPWQTLELPGLTLRSLEIDPGTAKCDVALFLRQHAGSLTGTLEYSTALFDAATMARLAGHFQTLLAGIVDHPDQRLAALPLLTAPERQELVVAWNATQVPRPPDTCLHELFEAQVARTPNAIAIVYEEAQLTYGALNRRANQVAHYLLKLGVGPETRVGLCVERSLAMLVGLLGILKAGGAYVPLDPAYPKERLAFLLEDAYVRVLLTQERLLQALPEPRMAVVCLDSDWERIAHESDKNPFHPTAPAHLAYVIYTSGSTGRPKGVQIQHRSVVHLCETTRPRFDFGADDVWTLFHSYAFDFSVWEIWVPLLYGSRLIITPLWVTQSPEAFDALLRTERVTVLNQTPSAMRQLMQVEARVAEPARDLALRLIICGGEAFPRELVPQLLAWEIPVWNFYGPTEATVWAAINQAEAMVIKEGAVPIGRPLPNTQLYVLGAYHQPVPLGVPGELHIGGVGLARGYLNRPELTAERFIPNPFSDELGERLYKTGDLVRYRPDGFIEFLGRIDNQVKLRGFRIELGEIEAVLEQHAAVQKTVVVAREDTPSDLRLVAYIVPAQEPAPTSRTLRHFLGAKLPPYMVPATFVLLEALPLTPNGKVDRRALPAPDWTRPAQDEAYVAPRTPVEEVLVQIWAEMLGVEQVGVYDDFFALGGHSLLATQVLARVRDAFQVPLPLRPLFEVPTVANLALAVMQSRGEQYDGGGDRIHRLDRGNAEQLLATLDQLSHAEVDALLSQRLKDERNR